MDTLVSSALSLVSRWVCVFVQSEPTHRGVRAQIWSGLVLCSHVRQQPLTPLYHLTGLKTRSIDTYGGPHLSKCSVALTLNLLYVQSKNVHCVIKVCIKQFGIVFLLCVVNFCKLSLQRLKIIM